MKIYFIDHGKFVFIHGPSTLSTMANYFTFMAIFIFHCSWDFFFSLDHGKIYFMKHGNLLVNISWYTFLCVSTCWQLLIHIFSHHAHNANLPWFFLLVHLQKPITKITLASFAFFFLFNYVFCHILFYMKQWQLFRWNLISLYIFFPYVILSSGIFLSFIIVMVYSYRHG